MRGDVFIHFVYGSRRVNIRLGVLLLIPKSPQYIATRNSGATARISVESVGNSWSVFGFLTIVMNLCRKVSYFVIASFICSKYGHCASQSEHVCLSV